MGCVAVLQLPQRRAPGVIIIDGAKPPPVMGKQPVKSDPVQATVDRLAEYRANPAKAQADLMKELLDPNAQIWQ